MTVLAGIGYLLIVFSPSIVIFRCIIVSDPLRVILFVLGAFFWLLSLLLSACVWFAVVPLREHLVFAIFVSVALQEGARLLHFVLLKKAQRGLSNMTSSSMQVAGVHTLRHARHILSIVCGLGMGVMAALFLVVNVIADFWGSGTVGLPAVVPNVSDKLSVKLNADDANFPITYSISACMLILSHVFWTVLFWDGCHKKGFTSTWWIGILFTVCSHYAMSGLSFWSRSKFRVAVLISQLIILLANAFFAFLVMGGSWARLKSCTTVAWSRIPCRRWCVKKETTGTDRSNEQIGDRLAPFEPEN